MVQETPPAGGIGLSDQMHATPEAERAALARQLRAWALQVGVGAIAVYAVTSFFPSASLLWTIFAGLAIGTLLVQFTRGSLRIARVQSDTGA